MTIPISCFLSLVSETRPVTYPCHVSVTRLRVGRKENHPHWVVRGTELLLVMFLRQNQHMGSPESSVSVCACAPVGVQVRVDASVCSFVRQCVFSVV